jgi:hypothetical protein
MLEVEGSSPFDSNMQPCDRHSQPDLFCAVCQADLAVGDQINMTITQEMWDEILDGKEVNGIRLIPGDGSSL